MSTAKSGKKSKKKIVIIVILVVLAIAAAVYFLVFKKPNSNMGNFESIVTGFKLSKGDVVESISTQGILESNYSENITTTLVQTKIQEVLVKEGDIVQEGDILCTLNVEDIQLELENAQKSLNQSYAEKGITNRKNERNYNETIESAQEKAEKAVTDAETKIIDARLAITAAEVELRNAMSAYSDAVTFDEDKWIPFDDTHEGYNSIKALELAVDTAQLNLKKAKQSVIDSEAELVKANEDLALTSAGTSKEQLDAKDDKALSQIASPFEAQEKAVEEAEKKLKDATIRATQTGTVASVSATVGSLVSATTGPLFIIEDTENYKIETNVKDFEINNVKVGSEVTITTEATGEKEYHGIVEYVAQSANRNADGTMVTTNIEFKVTVKLLDKDDDLKVGMNTKLVIILEEKKGVVSVPSHALTQNENGDDIVYVAVPTGKNNENDLPLYLIEERIVTVGVESNSLMEITGDEIKEDDIIIENIMGVTLGMETPVVIIDETNSSMPIVGEGGETTNGSGNGETVVGGNAKSGSAVVMG